MDYTSCARIDFGGRFSNFPTGDPLDILLQRVDRISKQLLVVLAQVCDPFRALGQSLLGMSFLSRLRSYEFSGDFLTLRG